MFRSEIVIHDEVILLNHTKLSASNCRSPCMAVGSLDVEQVSARREVVLADFDSANRRLLRTANIPSFMCRTADYVV